MNDQKDFTRWNRAGLSRIKYVDGNAATWLDEIRLQHLAQYLAGESGEVRTAKYWRRLFDTDPSVLSDKDEQARLKAALKWQDLWQPVPDKAETERERNGRLERTYQAPNTSNNQQTSEISRAFARALHVLTGRIDAYSNEGFLRTATQWDNLGKLANAIGYIPAPPASATTYVALTAKAEVANGTVTRGLGMKHAPREGGPPIIFESLEDIEVHHTLNALRTKGWDRSERLLDLKSETIWMREDFIDPVRIGDVALVEDRASGKAGAGLIKTLGELGSAAIGNARIAVTFDRIITHTRASDRARLIDGMLKGHKLDIIIMEKGNGPSYGEEFVRFLDVLNEDNSLIEDLSHLLERVIDPLWGKNGSLGPHTLNPPRGPDDGFNPVFSLKEPLDALQKLIKQIGRRHISLVHVREFEHIRDTINERLGIRKTVSSPLNPITADTILHLNPVKPKRARLRTKSNQGQVTISVGAGGRYTAGEIIGIRASDSNAINYIEVLEVHNQRITLSGSPTLFASSAPMDIIGLARYTTPQSGPLVSPASQLYITSHTGIESIEGTGKGGNYGDIPNTYGYDYDLSSGQNGYALPSGTPQTVDSAIPIAQPVMLGQENPASEDFIVEFDGAPDPGVAPGDALIARPDDTNQLDVYRIKSLRAEEDHYFIELDHPHGGNTHKMLFYGPFKAQLNPLNHDYNHGRAVSESGTIELGLLEKTATNLLKRGRKIQVSRDDDTLAVLGTIEKKTLHGGNVSIKLVEGGKVFEAFEKGETLIRLNIVKTGHGESRSNRILGSGIGEIPAQTFHLDVSDIAQIPTSHSSTGAAPDIEIEVEGEVWRWVESEREAELQNKTYTTRQREDGTHNILFRRRLTTGPDNIVVKHHRVGTGLHGNRVPPFSFKEPLSSNPWVEAIHQPFQPQGGSDKEDISNIRQSAPAHLKTLDRAVTVKDYVSLAKRHSSIIKAHASKVIRPGRDVGIDVTIMPADGSDPGEILKQYIKTFLQTHSLPGIYLGVQGFRRVTIAVSGVIRMDRVTFDEETVLNNVTTHLIHQFDVTRRDLGQSLYIGDIIGSIESVKGVAGTRQVTLTINGQTTPDGTPAIDHQIKRQLPAEGPIRALHAYGDQVIFIESPQAITLDVEAIQ